MTDSFRELDSRSNDRIDVRLLWRQRDDRADGRSFPPTQRELVIASLLARPDAHGSTRTG